MHKLEENSTTLSIWIAIIAYSLCSSTLLLANKMAMEYIPSASVISFVQILFSTIAVYIIKWMKWSDVDDFEWKKVRPYLFYIVCFVAAIYANMKALQGSNVETVIVFRACTPLAVCFIEFFFMDREFPSIRSSLSLLGVVGGAAVYCFSDSQLYLNGLSAYTWVIIYFVLITLEMTYGKTLTSTVKMDSVWGPVLYCNALSVIPMFILGSYEGDFFLHIYNISNLSVQGWTVIVFSCIVGTLIGYTGWLSRGMVSATCYTLVGVVNKFITVLLNVMVWNKHSTGSGILGVCICLTAGVFYQQAPPVQRANPQTGDRKVALKDSTAEERNRLLSSNTNREDDEDSLSSTGGIGGSGRGSAIGMVGMASSQRSGVGNSTNPNSYSDVSDSRTYNSSGGGNSSGSRNQRMAQNYPSKNHDLLLLDDDLLDDRIDESFNHSQDDTHETLKSRGFVSV